MQSKRSNPFPGGLLVLSVEGEILEAPIFFMDALRLQEREEGVSIYELFDDQKVPFLTFDRIMRRPNGIYEFYVTVIDESDRKLGFRYWSVSPSQPQHSTAPITFYIVDESSLLQAQEWQRRRLRRDILNDVRMTLSQYVRHRLTSIRALSEVLRDKPEVAVETSERLLSATDAIMESLDNIIDLRSELISDDQAYRVRLAEVAEIIGTWGDDENPIRSRGHNVPDALSIPTGYLDHIILPLVQNALEASYRDEIVEVDMWDLGNGYARIDIVDKGDGMSGYVRDRAEDPFFTTKSGHLGLGLPQAWEALQIVGGRWRIESQENQGTHITLLLPVDEL